MDLSLDASKRLVIGLAQAATGARDEAEALRQFSKQMIIGASRDKGDENLDEVFSRDLVSIFSSLNVLTGMTFLNQADYFRWDFSAYAWVSDPSQWGACDGLALIGMEADARFFFVTAKEAATLFVGGSVLAIRAGHADLGRWEEQWRALRETSHGSTS